MKKTFSKFGFNLEDPETGGLLNFTNYFPNGAPAPLATYDYKRREEKNLRLFVRTLIDRLCKK